MPQCTHILMRSRRSLFTRTRFTSSKTSLLKQWTPIGNAVSRGELLNQYHYSDTIMSAMASQTTGVSIVYSTVCWGVVQRKHQSPASLAFVRGIHWWPVNSPHKVPLTRKIIPFDAVIILPGYQQPWYWQCKINRAKSSVFAAWKEFHHITCFISVLNYNNW